MKTFYSQLDLFKSDFLSLIELYNNIAATSITSIAIAQQQIEILIANPIYKELNKVSLISKYEPIFQTIKQFTDERYGAYNSIIREKHQIISDYLEKKNRLESQIRTLTESKTAILRKLENICILKENKQIYDFIHNSIEQIVMVIRDTKIKSLEELTYKWYMRLVAVPQFKNIKINPENYAVQICPNDSPDDNYVEISDNLSGGNETLLAIAERLALIKNISEPIIMLDEPTDGTDSNNISSEIEGLAAISNMFPQIIMITHHQIGSQYANKVIQLKKDDATNSTTILSLT
jgi:DNA repair exonuclease SbcCD ATPase subunit